MAHIREEPVLGPVRLLGALTSGTELFQEGRYVERKHDKTELEADRQNQMTPPIRVQVDRHPEGDRTNGGCRVQIYPAVPETVPEDHPKQGNVQGARGVAHHAYPVRRQAQIPRQSQASPEYGLLGGAQGDRHKQPKGEDVV